MSVNRTEIKFLPNVPVEFILDRSEGKEYPSKFDGAESRWYYTVNGNTAFLYLPTTARNKLVRTQAQAGDTVRICKTQDGQSSMWRIEVLSDTHEPAAEPAPKPAASAPGPRMVAPRNQGANALAPQHAPVAQAQANPMLRLMYQCLLDSFQVNMRAWEKCIEQSGLQMEAPNWEDIRTTATSLFIETNRGGAR